MQEHDHARHAGFGVWVLLVAGLPALQKLLAAQVRIVPGRPVEEPPRLLVGEFVHVSIFSGYRAFHTSPSQP